MYIYIFLERSLIELCDNYFYKLNKLLDLSRGYYTRTSFNSRKCADRKNAESSYDELVRLFPSIQFELQKIDISKEELDRIRADQIKYLINPRLSVLDDSIGNEICPAK